MSQFNPNPQQFGGYQPPYHTPKPANQPDAKAVASLVLGLLSFVFSALTGIPAIILGLMALLGGRRPASGKGLAIAGIITGCVGSLLLIIPIVMLVTMVSTVRESVNDASERAEATKNLKEIGLALHNHHDTRGAFPAAFSVDESGKPLLSWRVAILPYIGHKGLYDQFKLDEPWDSAHNKRLIDQMPAIYRAPGAETGSSETVYLAVVGQNSPGARTAFRTDGKGSTYSHITDGTANTIAVVEANEDQAVIWTKPDDLNFDPQNPRRGVGAFRSDHFLALFVDGSVHSIRNTVDDKTLEHLFRSDDGQVVDF